MATPIIGDQRRNHLGLALVALAIMLDGFDIQIMGYVTPALLAEWKVAKLGIAPILTAGLAGMIVGSAIAGTLGDLIGRRVMLAVSLLVLGAATLGCSFALNPTQLAVGRFIAGIGMGGAIPNAIAVIFLLAPPKLRVFLVAAAAVFVPLGGALGGLVAAHFVPIHGWRFMFIVGGVSPLVLAAVIGLALRVPRTRISGEAKGSLPKTARLDISRPVLVTTASLCLAFFSCLFSLYTVLNWLPTLLAQAGLGMAQSSLAITVVNVGGIIAALWVGWKSSQIGSRVPLAVMFASGALAAMILCIAGDILVQHYSMLLLLLLIIGVATTGAQSILLAFAAETYEERIRATGVGWAVGFGRLGGIGSTFAGAILLGQAAAMERFFLVVAIVLTIAMTAVLTIRPDRTGI